MIATYHMILGDINVNIRGEMDQISEYLDTMGKYNFMSVINEYTHIQGASKS